MCNIAPDFVHAFQAVVCTVSGACRRYRVASVNASCCRLALLPAWLDCEDFTCWVPNWICAIWEIRLKEVSNCSAPNTWKCSHTTALCSAFNSRVCPYQHKQRTNSSQILTGKEGATFLSRSFKLRKVQQRRTSHSSCTRCFSYNNAVKEGCVTHPITQRAAICSLATCRSNQCLWQQEMSE